MFYCKDLSPLKLEPFNYFWTDPFILVIKNVELKSENSREKVYLEVSLNFILKYNNYKLALGKGFLTSDFRAVSQ